MAKIKRYIALMMAVMLLAILTGCKETPAPEVKDEKLTYSITVVSQDGTPVKDVKIFVYEDPSQAELVSVDKTDENGCISFIESPRDGFVAILRDVPAGYEVEDLYTISIGENEIVLLERALTPEELSSVRYDVGDRIKNLSVTDCDGNRHNVGELLEDKEAVVLNFWYLNCDPCKMEFPYLQEAFDIYGDKVAFLALNPYDGTDETVSNYRYEQRLSFPMISCDVAYQMAFQVNSFPTTMIIDRTGTICLVHEGMFTDSTALCNALEYFIQNDYEQQLFDIIEDIPGV